MKYLCRIMLVALLALILGAGAFAHRPFIVGAAIEQTEQPGPMATISPTPSLTEADLLRAQLEIMKEYDQKLMQTVYWALAGIAALALLVAGVSWFSNLRLYQRDRDALRDELGALSQRSSAEIREGNTKELSAIRAGLAKTVESEVSSRTDKFDAAVESLRSEIAALRLSDVELEARQWEAYGSPGNALTYYSKALAQAVEISRTGHYSDLLNSIIRVLGQVRSVTSWDTSRLTPILSQLPHDYETEVARIRQLLDEKLGP